MSKVIKKMTKPELIELFEKTINNANKINSVHDDICESRKTIEDIKSDILNKYDETGKIGFLEEIENSRIEIVKKYDEIINMHYEVLKDDEENESIKTQLDKLVSKFTNRNEEFKEIESIFFGSKYVNDDGDDVEKIGYIKKIKAEIKESQGILKELEEKINKELISGTTSISLSNNFKEKSKEYKKSRRIWEKSFLIILISTVIYSILSIDIEVTNINEALIGFIPHVPIFSLFLWLVIFVGNRRAESKKLEESYTHKAVIAQSFVGYKDSITSLDDKDNELLIIHMNNLLAAISKDSGAFLDSKGESHPAIEAGKKLLSAKNNND